MIVSQDRLKGLQPGTIYGNGIGEFLTLLLGRDQLQFAVTFGAMAFSTFVFDTLDVCTRLGRYIVQELLGWTGRRGAAAATLATIALPAYFLGLAGEGAYIKFWTLFGASNQLLAALSLLCLSLWLRQEGRRCAFTLLPMVFVLAITLWALVRLAYSNLRGTAGLDVPLANGVAAIALILLALYIVLTALVRFRAERASSAAAPAAS
jgi:carbon starvation protein